MNTKACSKQDRIAILEQEVRELQCALKVKQDMYDGWILLDDYETEERKWEEHQDECKILNTSSLSISSTAPPAQDKSNSTVSTTKSEQEQEIKPSKLSEIMKMEDFHGEHEDERQQLCARKDAQEINILFVKNTDQNIKSCISDEDTTCTPPSSDIFVECIECREEDVLDKQGQL